MRILTSLATLMVAASIFMGCSSKKEETAHSPFHPQISAFTSGQISVKSPIMVEFASPVQKAEAGQPVSKSVLKISPSVDGEATWAGNRTLVFKPSEMLPSGEEFKVEIDLPKLLPEEEEPFFFTFRTIEQNAWISADMMRPASVSDYETYQVTARVSLADVAENDLVEEEVEVTLNGKTVKPEWTHIDGRNHELTVNNVPRKDAAGKLKVIVAEGPLSPREPKTLNMVVPAIDAFKIISAELSTSPRNVITVTFSDPVDPGQDISGLFLLDNKDLDWNIDNNQIELYPGEAITGERTLVILPDVKNVSGRKLSTKGEFSFVFSSEKPEVEMIGDGTIMPFSDGLYMPFRAVSLKAVRVRIIKIYEHNIGHFLQVNRLGGESQLKRAGRLVHKQRIKIDTDPTVDLYKWNTFSLDLSKFVQPDPGAIYRVEIGFEQADAIYPCAGDEDEDTSGTETASDPDEDFWDEPNNYYSTYPYHYNPNYSWRERDNPCSSSYYTRDKWVAKNVLASNLGLLAKRGTNDELLVTVTDIRTAEPIKNIDVEVFNLQMAKIAEGKTGNEGQVSISLDETPFLLVAKQDKQRGYLRLDDGQALAYDRFDVSGETVKEGLRGFIFGERGVWRPGDSIFVSFMPMESQPGTLPPNHPVTFELTDPRGRLIDRQTSVNPDNTLYTFRTKTSEDAPTGMWLARVKMGGVVFEKSLRIETIRPNRLKINLKVVDEVLKSGNSGNFSIQSEWLHGSPASDLKADVRMNVRSVKTTFEDYTGYNFDDPTRDLQESEVTVFEGKLDESGEASFRKQIPEFDRAPGKLAAVFTTRVFEEGGSFSIATDKAPLSPFDVYTGIQTPPGDDRGLLLTDQDHQIDLVSVDANGEPVTDQELVYMVYKIDWRWWWEKSDEDLGRYISSRSRNVVDSGTLKTDRNGKGSFQFRVDKPEWGRYLIRVVNSKSRHSTATTVQVDWPGWARESRGGDGASHLVFSTDKRTYKVGDDIEVTFPSSEQGRALVSLETGSRVLKSWWVEPNAKETKFSFEAAADMTPNIYISVTLIQPYEQTANNRPLRLYGIVPVMIEDPATRLEPELKTKEVWRPGEKAEIEVSEANNEPMDYVVAVVDEGLLDLTNFRTPNPWGRFNARQALGVKTWDLYDEVLGAFGGKIEQLFSVGGDGSLSGDKGKNQMRRFEPMVRFFGPYKLRKRKENEHSFEVPSYTGSVRVMVIGSNGEATGSSDATVKVKKPVMVWSSLPRVLSPNEKLSLPVTVFVTEENIRNVEVSLQGSEHYEVIGDAKKTLSFDGPGEKNVYFEIATKQLTGSSQIIIKAKGGREEAVLTKSLEIRMPNPPVTKTQFAVLDGNASRTFDYQLPGIIGTNQVRLEASTLPPMDLTKRLNYLTQYPHGCIEQITSGGFPQLYLDKVMELDNSQRNTIRENVSSVLERYSNYQTPEGGFAYWPGQNQPSDWGSSYAGHFLLEAEKKGYVVRPGIKDNWLDYQKKKARSWLPKPETRYYTSEQMLQGYRLYTLALAGEPATGAMNRLRQQSGLIVQARWLLASAYALSGMHEVAEELMNQAGSAEQAKVQYRTYGSSLRDKAILINALTLLNNKETAMPLVREAADRISNDRWYSTQTTAWTLMSIVNFAGQNMESKGLQFTMKVDGESPVTIGTDKPISQREINTGQNNSGSIEVSNDHSNELFVTLVMTGTPAGVDSTSFSENLKLSTRLLTMDDKTLSASRLEQGTDFKYVVRISNPGTAGDAENLALTQMIPSGWEIRNTRLEGSNVHERDIPDYRDIRDDRVLSYFDLKAGESKEFVVVVHAAFPGEFYLPPVTCEAMYNHSIRARVAGRKTEVVTP
ncbi:alpha-2-macroglobulin [Marinilabilia sp.]